MEYSSVFYNVCWNLLKVWLVITSFRVTRDMRREELNKEKVKPIWNSGCLLIFVVIGAISLIASGRKDHKESIQKALTWFFTFSLPALYGLYQARNSNNVDYDRKTSNIG